MKPSALLGTIVLLIAAGTLAQPGEKPKITIPEPTRQSPSTPEQTFTITVVEYNMAQKNRDSFTQAIPELIAFFRTGTDVNARLRWNKLHLNNPSAVQASLLYMTGNDAVVQFADQEKKNLGEYLRKGGLLFAEDIRHSSEERGLTGMEAGVMGTPFDRQLKALLRDPLVLGGQGQNWQKIPRDHPLYRSYFDFPDGPPRGGAPGGNVTDLEMLQVRGRTVVIFSDLNISWYWGDALADARQRGLQFGCNLIVFALTQQAMNW